MKAVLAVSLSLVSCSHTTTREVPLRDEVRFAQAHAKVAVAGRGQWLNVEGHRFYVALPASGQPPFPGVLVMHTARGLTRDIQLWTDRLAEEGYAAVAVDLYGGRTADELEQAKALRDEVNKHPVESLATLRRAYDFLAEDTRIRARRRALIGWSYGGAWATYLASKWTDVSAVVAYYGTADANADAVASITAPVLLICGHRDEAAEDVVEFDEALRTNGKASRVLWNNEGHNFADPSHPRYSGPAAAEAYDAVRNFLRLTLTD